MNSLLLKFVKQIEAVEQAGPQGAVCRFVSLAGRRRFSAPWFPRLSALFSLPLTWLLFHVDHWSLWSQPYRALEHHWPMAVAYLNNHKLILFQEWEIRPDFPAAFLSWCPCHKVSDLWPFGPSLFFCSCVFMGHRCRQRVATTPATNRDIFQAAFLPLWTGREGKGPSKLHEWLLLQWATFLVEPSLSLSPLVCR